MIALILGILIGSVSTVTASTDYVQAQFAKFNLVINGEGVELEADPLVYQGTTYLPVRVMSNTLGYDVTYKADSRTIEMQDSENVKIEKETEIIEMGVVEGMAVESIVEIPNMTIDEIKREIVNLEMKRVSLKVDPNREGSLQEAEIKLAELYEQLEILEPTE